MLVLELDVGMVKQEGNQANPKPLNFCLQSGITQLLNMSSTDIS